MISRTLTAVLLSLAMPAGLLAQEAGRGALRPYVHVLLAYGAAWLLILLWVWMIARNLKRAGASPRADEG
ncbi:MAG: hypothetical protein OXQ94_00595 [Gemmatimonadota bacterium]|nr:hypothetical protein [Gemmatimonadota bacterium]MDE2870178.1 hypothetical protein [Gemmatimonadota bacterium]